MWDRRVHRGKKETRNRRVLEGEEEAVHVQVQSKHMGLVKILSSVSVVVSIKTSDGSVVISVIAIQVSIERTNGAIGGRRSARAREVISPSPTLEGVAQKTIETTEFLGIRDDIFELGASVEKVIDRTAIVTCFGGIMREKFVDVEDSVIVIKDLAKVERGFHLTNRSSRRRTLGRRFER